MSCFTRSSNSAKLIVAVVGAAALAACSGRSPAAPSASSIASDAVSAKGGGSAPGVYDLSFNVFSQRTYELVASLRVRSQELILMAHVTDGSGAAEAGADDPYHAGRRAREPRPRRDDHEGSAELPDGIAVVGAAFRRPM